MSKFRQIKKIIIKENKLKDKRTMIHDTTRM